MLTVRIFNFHKTHPARRELMAWLDGECSAAQARSILRHVEDCGLCQSEQVRISSVLQRGRQLREEAFASLAPNWAMADARLAQLAQHMEGTGRRRRPIIGFSLCAATAALICLWVFIGKRPHPGNQTAVQILQKAQQNEAQVPVKQVVYSKLQLERSASDGSKQKAYLERWHSRNRQWTRLGGDGAAWIAWRKVAERNHQSDDGLSAGSFASWAASHGGAETETLSGDRVKLTTRRRQSVQQDEIVTAIMVVRTGDWHVVAARYEVAAGQNRQSWYRFREVEWKTVTEREMTVAPSAHKVPRVSKHVLSTGLAQVSRGAIVARMVDAMALLHDTGACMGEGLTVQPSASGQILVKGVVESDERAREIQAALARVPDIHFELTVPRMRATRIRGKQRPVATHSAPPLLEKWLIAHHYDRREISIMATSALLDSNDALQHAWAIRNLTAVVPEYDRALLSGEEKAKLLSLYRFHRNGIYAALTRLRARLGALLQIDSREADMATNGNLFEAVSALHREIVLALVNGWQAENIPLEEARQRLEKKWREAMASASTAGSGRIQVAKTQ